jgi:hypothetical protein
MRKKKGEKKFNLPIGIYYTDNTIFELPKPITYIVAPMPKPEKQIEMKNLQVNIINGFDKKANINVGEGIINMRAEFFQMPRPIWLKVYFHEIGHHMFFSEHLCDRFADLCMLKMGYNPSQLIAGTLCSLDNSERNLQRIKYNYANGLNTKQKR